MPTMAELANMPTVSEIASWCDFEESDDLAGLFTLLDAKTTTKTRILGAIPQQSLESAIEKWRLPSGDGPSQVLQAKAGLLGAVARLAQERRVERQKMGDYPRPEEDVTPEQLAALRALFVGSAAVRGPDSVGTVWGPYGHRIQRKLRFSGQVLGAQGVLQTVQLYGPPTVCEWQTCCWAIFKTGSIVLQELSPSTLDLWEKVVTNHASRYGPETWALIYQAEVTARLEHMCRRRDGAAARVQATAAGGDLPFLPDSPWEWVFRETAHDTRFWRAELEEPALLIKAQVAGMSVCRMKAMRGWRVSVKTCISNVRSEHGDRVNDSTRLTTKAT